MRVPFVFGPGDLRLVEVERPQFGPRNVRLEVGTEHVMTDVEMAKQPTGRPRCWCVTALEPCAATGNR